jgi:ABC-type transport system involved in multi-copper enzyme maturation permease subunit
MRPRALTRRSEADPIRRVTGSPVLWRERQVRFGLGRFAGVVVWAFIGGTAIALDSVAIWMAGNFTADGLCLGVSVMLLVATMLVATIQSGPALAAEREAGTLSLLLTTPLGAGRIVYEKALGAMRHSMPVWGLLLAHVIVVVAVGFFHPILVLHVALILAGVLVMVTGIGMLIGAWVRRAATAAMLNLLVMGVVFAGPPAVVMALAEYGPSGGGNAEYSLYVFHPVSQIVMASEGASYATQSGFDGRRHRVLSYDLGPRLRIGKSTEAGWAYVTMLLILTSGVQVGVGVAAGALAVRRLRRTGG